MTACSQPNASQSKSGTTTIWSSASSDKPDSAAAENKRGGTREPRNTHCSAASHLKAAATSELLEQRVGSEMHFSPLSESETQGMQMILLAEWSSSVRKLVGHVPTGECPTCPHSPWLVSDIFIEDHHPMRPLGEPHLRIRLCRQYHRHPWLCSLPVWSVVCTTSSPESIV